MNVGVGPTPPAPPSVVRDESLVVPCSDAEMNELLPSITELGDLLWQVTADQSAAPFVKQLEAFYTSPCYALSKLNDDVDLSAFDSGASLLDWWQRGGSEFFRAPLSAESGARSGLGRTRRA